MSQRRLQDLIMSGRMKYEALGSDYEPEKAVGSDGRTNYDVLGSDYEPEKALGSNYEWKNEI